MLWFEAGGVCPTCPEPTLNDETLLTPILSLGPVLGGVPEGWGLCQPGLLGAPCSSTDKKQEGLTWKGSFVCSRHLLPAARVTAPTLWWIFRTTWAGWFHKHVTATEVLQLQHREFWRARFGRSLAPALDAWEQQKTDQVGTSTKQQAEHQGPPPAPSRHFQKLLFFFCGMWDIFMLARDATQGLMWWRTAKTDCKPLGWCLRNFRRPLENLVGAPWALAGSSCRQALGSTSSSSPAMSL